MTVSARVEVAGFHDFAGRRIVSGDRKLRGSGARGAAQLAVAVVAPGSPRRHCHWRRAREAEPGAQGKNCAKRGASQGALVRLAPAGLYGLGGRGHKPARWADGRVVEGARLERVYTCKRIEGSNPSLSASQSNSFPHSGFAPTYGIDLWLLFHGETVSRGGAWPLCTLEWAERLCAPDEQVDLECLQSPVCGRLRAMRGRPIPRRSQARSRRRMSCFADSNLSRASMAVKIN